ncbi:MAG: LptA/OstA family protein [Armatimonadota bacterium]|nr:LptA/OstA family protein [Armatimonadota bacterium]
MRRRLAVVTVAVAVAGGGFLWLVRTEQAAPEQPVERTAVRATGTSIVLRHRGVRRAEITADRVEVSADRRFTVFTGRTRAMFFDGDRQAAEARGAHIVLDRARRTVRVDGGLTLVTARGDRLTAQAATWDQDSHLIELVGQVTGTTTRPSPTGGSQEIPVGFGRLRADRIRYDTRAHLIVASGHVQLEAGEVTMSADVLRVDTRAQVATAEGAVSVRRREATLVAPVVRYEFRTDQATATGGAVFRRPDATVRSPEMHFDLRHEVTTASGGVAVEQADGLLTASWLRYEAPSGDVVAEGGVSLTRPGVKLTGRRLLANLQARRADVRGEVVLVRSPGPPPSPSDRVLGALAKEETTVTAGRIVFLWAANEAEAEDRVEVRQRDKTAWADRMTYSEPANRLVLTGRVVLEQTSGEWLVREGLVAPPRDPRDQQALASVTRLTCTRLTMTLRERDITADGPLTVTQKERSVSGDRATYTEATRVLVVTGNVRMQDADGQRLRADRVVISLDHETFEAEGDVQTEFVVRPLAPSPNPTARPTPTPR